MIKTNNEHHTHQILENYPDMLLVSEVAGILRLKNTAMYALLRSNAIKHYRTEGKYLIPKSAVIEYLENCIDETA